MTAVGPGLVPSRSLRPKIFLHIGAMKTGTTYLQTLMMANRGSLLEAGFLFPGDKWNVQSRAARDILGFSIEDPRRAAEIEGRWAAVAQEMLEHRGESSVMSMEFFSFADPEQAARVVESLAGAELHVILTVRDATSAIPTQWQTGCRNGKRLPFPRFLAGVREVLRNGEQARSAGARMILRTQWAPRMLDTWVPLLGRDRVHVISVPPKTADPRELWNRFASVTGIPAEACVEPALDSNSSLGLASTELLRRLNAEIRDLPAYDYELVVKRRVAREILTTRKASEAPIALNQRGHRLARRWNRATRQAIADHGVSFTGADGDLPSDVAADELPTKLPRPSDGELLAAADTAAHGLRTWLRQVERALRTGDRELGMAPIEWSPEGGATVGTSSDEDSAVDRVPRAVSELADLVREGVALMRQLRQLEAPAESSSGSDDDDHPGGSEGIAL